MESDGNECVYFILQNETHVKQCKIGKSANDLGVWKRYLSNGTGNPKATFLLGYLKNSNEEYWHNYFRQYRIKGEWFNTAFMLPILYNLDLKVPDAAYDFYISYKSKNIKDEIEELYKKKEEGFPPEQKDLKEIYTLWEEKQKFYDEQIENLENKLQKIKLQSKEEIKKEYKKFVFTVPKENKVVKKFNYNFLDKSLEKEIEGLTNFHIESIVDVYDALGWQDAKHFHYDTTIKEEYKIAESMSDTLLTILNYGGFFGNIVHRDWIVFRYSTLKKTTIDECGFPIMAGETCFVCGEGFEKFKLSYISVYRYYYANMCKKYIKKIINIAKEDEKQKSNEMLCALEAIEKKSHISGSSWDGENN